ncbi:MAG TPA: Wzz/FepE/Etk N-terminal domain-containing protein [Solirubrobacteraceae bacterium]|nr:Wzz/FepE/Etk N-terminal domain-containing protein [Solirubrobacteraceae bacterium]
MTDTRHVSLRDLLRVLRKARGSIVVLTLLCAAIAAGWALSREREYAATARVTFQAESRSNAVAGVNAAPSQTGAQLAAAGAATMLSAEVLQRVRGRLRSDRTIGELRPMLETSVDPSSALVSVTARADDRHLAAALANEVARGAVTIQKNQERERYARAAERLESQYEQLRPEGRSGSRTELAAANLLDRISTLRSLSLNASPARLAYSASVPAAPISPKPLRSGALGGLLGLLLGIAAAFVRNALDRRLRDSSQIKETLDLPVVGMVRIEALGNAAYVPNGRGPMTDQDVESFRILRKNVEFLDVDHPIKLIAVTSPLPEEGKSTVAASLAAAYAAAGRRTLLVECDLRRPSLPERLSVRRRPGLSDYLAGQVSAGEILQIVTLAESDISAHGGAGADGDGDGPKLTAGKLVVIAAGSQSVRPAELLGSKRFRDFLAQVGAAYDTVVLDTPPLLSVSDTLEILPLVHCVLLCVRADQTTRDEARAVKDALARLPERTTGIVVTGLKPGREHDYGYYSHAYYGES